MSLKERIKPILSTGLSVAVALLLLSYSAYGWMMMAKEIRAEGVNVSFSVPQDLQISLKPDTDFNNTVSVDLDQIVKATVDDSFVLGTDHFNLLPASSFEGLSLWQTESAFINGTATCEEYEFRRGKALSRTGDSHLFEGHYVDVSLYLRSSSRSLENIVLNKDRCAVSGANDSTGNDVTGIVRAAFLNADATAPSYTENSNDYARSLVYADTQRSATSHVVTDNGSGISKLTNALYVDFNEQNQSNQIICQVGNTVASSNGTIYTPTQITLRIWIEGQDAACRGSLMNDKKAFRIDLGFDVQK